MCNRFNDNYVSHLNGYNMCNRSNDNYVSHLNGLSCVTYEMIAMCII